MGAIHITEENFEQEVMKSEKPVLLDFWGENCVPCKRLSPVIDELAEEVSHAKIGKVNVYDEPELVEKYSIISVPTLLVIKNGEVVKQAVGIQPKSVILDMLN